MHNGVLGWLAYPSPFPLDADLDDPAEGEDPDKQRDELRDGVDAANAADAGLPDCGFDVGDGEGQDKPPKRADYEACGKNPEEVCGAAAGGLDALVFDAEAAEGEVSVIVVGFDFFDIRFFVAEKEAADECSEGKCYCGDGEEDEKYLEHDVVAAVRVGRL